MIARDVIVSFYIYSLLKSNKIYGKIWSMILSLTNKVIDLALSGGYYQVWSVKFMLVFFFMTRLSSYDNIFETETWHFWSNMKMPSGHIYTRWTYEGVDITRRLTKW